MKKVLAAIRIIGTPLRRDWQNYTPVPKASEERGVSSKISTDPRTGSIARPDAEQTAEEDKLAEVIRVVVDEENRL